MSELYILYGSQTGNSEDIAKDLNGKCIAAGLNSLCMTLNAAKKVALRDVAKCVVVVCSTTGNGDAPENCEAWWRSTKLRSVAKDTYANVPFTVLGLGDTNYDKFCHMGKSIFKRLGELGGKPFMDLRCADEATGLEETVENWKAEVLRKLVDIMTASSSSETPSEEIVQSSETLENCRVEISSTHNDDNIINATDTANVLDHLKTQELSYSAFCRWVNILDTVKQSIDASHLPNIKKLVDAYESTQIVPASDSQTFDANQSTEWNSSHPFLARVTNAKWLTPVENVAEAEDQWGSKKRVVHMELSLTGSGIEYSPGDSIGICCPNPENAVSFVLKRLQESHRGAVAVTGETIVSSYATGQREVFTLNELLSYRLDLISVPRKTSVAALSKHCHDREEQMALEWISSKSDAGKVLWSQFVEAQRLGLADLLRLFPSCSPPLGALVAIAPSMSPRYYSIANSPLAMKETVAVAFSVVRFKCGVTVPSQDADAAAQYGNRSPIILKRGLCTSFLEDNLRRWLFPSLGAPNEDVTLKVFLRPSIAFRLPSSISSPLILIGPGTGVAPFIGFLQHRAALERARVRSGDDVSTGIWRGGFELENEDLPAECNTIGQFVKSSSPGPIHLFYGCRDETDFLYRDELTMRLHEQTLTSLNVAFSRVSNEKVYVTHKMREKLRELAQLILEEEAHVYICGDGNRMASDVQHVLQEALKEHGCLEGDKLDEYYKELKLRRRLVLDIWS